MKREFLKELGLSDEQIDKIMAEYGRAVNSMKEELEKAKELEKQIEGLQQQLKQRDQQLEDLKSKVAGNEELQKQIQELQDQNKQLQKEYEAKIKQQQFDFALESALRDAKAKNPKAVKALLNLEAIKLVDGKLVGLEEQLKTLKETDDYLFVPDGLKGKTPAGVQNPNSYNKANPFTKEHFNLTQQGKLIRENPEQARQFILQAGLNPETYGL